MGDTSNPRFFAEIPKRSRPIEIEKIYFEQLSDTMKVFIAGINKELQPYSDAYGDRDLGIDEPPKDQRCPITWCAADCPVNLGGHIFDLAALISKELIKTSVKGKKVTYKVESPLTHILYKLNRITPSYAVRNIYLEAIKNATKNQLDKETSSNSNSTSPS